VNRALNLSRRGAAPRLGPLLAAALTFCVCAAPAAAQSDPDAPVDLSVYGIFYDEYEPSFYTGFAPRTQDPRRLHLHVGRGNQLRMTLVLSDEVIADYARNLADRYETYRTLIDQGKLKLTQNQSFAAFEQTLKDIGIQDLVTGETDLTDAALRTRNLDLIERLNPGRVFRISIPIDDLVKGWASKVTAADRKSPPKTRRLELINLLLPTRLWVTGLDPAVSKALTELIGRVPVDADVQLDEVREAYLALLEQVSGGIYPVDGNHLRFVEFTAIHPVGTFNSYVTHKGRKIPQYPTPGRRALTYHQRTKTVDHIPTVGVYGYLPWIPYMHVGKRLHNSFHTLWWRMNPQQTRFLPEEIREGERAVKGDGKPHRYLWLLSRGPMSSGCTHVNAGHISELREMLPAPPELMDDVDAFINKSHLFDVFDIDGDLKPEVMGVRYFVAYSLSKKKPRKLRAPTERRGFYDWLYGGELKYHPSGKGWFADIRDGQFVGRKAVNGREYKDIDLYEAEYEPEKIQFYEMVDIPFARALRQAGENDQ
jgi:hypothetical protein